MKTLVELYKNHTGKVSDKWDLYLHEYDRLFSPYRTKPISILEIGIQNGGSLEIWSKYFVNANKVIGCDINQRCAQLKYDDPRIAVIVGDATSTDAREKIIQQAGIFDLIIDDGSHVSGDIVRAFTQYFPMLREGGVFVVEDLHCSYWEEYEGGIFHPYSSINFFKTLADVVNHEHWGTDRTRGQLLSGFREEYKLGISDEWLATIHSIEFINSLCIITKLSAESNCLGMRRIAGRDESIVSGLICLSDSVAVPPQFSNSWSSFSRSPSEVYQSLNQDLAERDGQILSLNQDLAERDRQISAILQSTSWRVTAPYRTLGRQAKRIQRWCRGWCGNC